MTDLVGWILGRFHSLEVCNETQDFEHKKWKKYNSACLGTKYLSELFPKAAFVLLLPFSPTFTARVIHPFWPNYPEPCYFHTKASTKSQNVCYPAAPRLLSVLRIHPHHAPFFFLSFLFILIPLDTFMQRARIPLVSDFLVI